LKRNKGHGSKRRWLARLGLTLAVVGGGTIWASTAWASSGIAEPTFYAAGQQIQMAIPSGGCQSDCQWELYVNEPGAPGAPTVAAPVGTSGTLVVPYPPNFCGTVQADVLVKSGSGPWTYETGTRGSVDTSCPGAANNSGTAPVTSSALPATVTAATSATSTPTTDPVAAAATSLPFTGANLGPIAFVGITAILVGALLLAESWFGWVRRLAHAGPVRRVDAMLSWFLGR
jgi:hypothetical protein